MVLRRSIHLHSMLVLDLFIVVVGEVDDGGMSKKVSGVSFVVSCNCALLDFMSLKVSSFVFRAITTTSVACGLRHA